jgi:hypothetical protein
MAALTLQFSLTQAGQQSIFTQNNLGLQLSLTHLQAGSGQYAAMGLETKLKTPLQAVTLADGGRSADGLSINMLAVLEGDSNFPIGELGLWAGDPSLPSSVLVAVWSETKAQIAAKLGLAAGYDPSIAYIGFKSSKSAWQFAHTLSIADAGAGVINVTVDPSASVAANLMREHVSQPSPHPNSRETIEINNAIQKSGQILQTNIPNPSQLWNAISSSRYKSVGTVTVGQTTTTGQVITNTLNFTAPCDGFVILNAILNVSKESAGRYTNAVFVNGSNVVSLGEAGTTVNHLGVACTKGTSYAFQQKVTATTGGTASLVTVFSYSCFAGSI